MGVAGVTAVTATNGRWERQVPVPISTDGRCLRLLRAAAPEPVEQPSATRRTAGVEDELVRRHVVTRPDDGSVVVPALGRHIDVLA